MDALVIFQSYRNSYFNLFDYDCIYINIFVFYVLGEFRNI
jgi:hypothetical protein